MIAHDVLEVGNDRNKSQLPTSMNHSQMEPSHPDAEQNIAIVTEVSLTWGLENTTELLITEEDNSRCLRLIVDTRTLLHSAVHRIALEGPWKEARTKKIILKEVKPAIFQSLLEIVIDWHMTRTDANALVFYLDIYETALQYMWDTDTKRKILTRIIAVANIYRTTANFGRGTLAGIIQHLPDSELIDGPHQDPLLRFMSVNWLRTVRFNVRSSTEGDQMPGRCVTPSQLLLSDFNGETACADIAGPVVLLMQAIENKTGKSRAQRLALHNIQGSIRSHGLLRS